MTMASTVASSEATATSAPISTTQRKSARPRRPNYNYIHRNLLPLEIHPLPVLIPHNPLSLVAVALSYLAQLLSTPSQPIYNGYFSSATSSIHVTDPKTIRKLWEMGFFGRGSLSRSEPTWLQSQRRKGSTAEENTGQRREERRKAKMERAKKELEAVEEKLKEEKKTIPNEDLTENLEEPLPEDRLGERQNVNITQKPANEEIEHVPETETTFTGNDPPDPADGHILNEHTNGDVLKTNFNDLADIGSVLESDSRSSTPQPDNQLPNGGPHGYDEWKKTTAPNGIPTPPPTTASSDSFQADTRPLTKLQRVKSVRFSPTIEAREFDLSAPIISPLKSPGPSSLVVEEKKESSIVENQEHLQLSLEEAFFLIYSLGVLQVYSDDSDEISPATSLLSLFRRYSYFPPKSSSLPAEPDDPFMISYAVYHHYRSLGWVVRSGVKFSVDYLLYNRGPAFSHAEFALVILPSYTASYWSESEEQRKHVETKTNKSWWWLHNVNRVQAQVKKSLVLCYVGVPPPPKSSEKGEHTDIGKLFGRYTIRDIGVKRFTPNRMRD